ncbi:MAG: Glycosyl hydrolase family 98, putative carbohydrate binding module, partial [uncultured Adhaeribacter sp.]
MQVVNKEIEINKEVNHPAAPGHQDQASYFIEKNSVLTLKSIKRRKALTIILSGAALVIIVCLVVFINSRPYVIDSSPKDGAENVSVNTVSIAANNLYVPETDGFSGGVDNRTISNQTVKLLKIVGNNSTDMMGTVQGTGGGDAISFSPNYALEPNTIYKFVITSGVKSHDGSAFVPYTATFTTGEARPQAAEPMHVTFTKVPVTGTQDKKYASLTFGPDGKVYALRLDGVIERFNVDRSDGSLTNQQEIKTLTNKFNIQTAIGLVFDPASTADNLVAYVTHCSFGLGGIPVFDGNISQLSGPNLEEQQFIITKLPRSTKDHLVNSMAFGPDSALYFSQGSNSSMGAYDSFWQRDETLLSGAILRLDFKKLRKVILPLNVQTTQNQQLINQAPSVAMRMPDGTYNPYGSESPLTIYASGIRNAYDLIWHSNGQLYVPANGSAAGGNTPVSVAGTRRPDGTFYHGPFVPATSGGSMKTHGVLIKNLFTFLVPSRLLVPSRQSVVQNDWLFRINPVKPVGYYGHPNPMRGEYVANRGYPDNPKYEPTIRPDANYRGAAFNFGLNKSPNGVIEYQSNTFNGALKGKLLVCRFSGGGDIMVLEPGSLIKDNGTATFNDKKYDIVSANPGASTNGLVGMSGFANPLDIVEDTLTGNLYLIEFNRYDNPKKKSQIILLRAKKDIDPAKLVL